MWNCLYTCMYIPLIYLSLRKNLFHALLIIEYACNRGAYSFLVKTVKQKIIYILPSFVVAMILWMHKDAGNINLLEEIL